MSVFMEQSERYYQEGDFVSGEDVKGVEFFVVMFEDGLCMIFGFDYFWLGQCDVMEVVFCGINFFVVMFIGFGKSFCY